MKLKEFRSEQLVRYILHVGVVRSEAWGVNTSKPIRDEAPAILPFLSPHTPRLVAALLLLPTARHAFLS